MKEFLKKFKSTKFIMTVWCMSLTTYIVIANKPEFFGLAQLLSAAPLVYCGCNVWQKNIYSKTDLKIEK